MEMLYQSGNRCLPAGPFRYGPAYPNSGVWYLRSVGLESLAQNLDLGFTPSLTILSCLSVTFV